MQSQSSLKPVRTLIKIAQKSPGRALPNETHQSFPMPVPGPTGLRVLFMYCTSVTAPGVGLQLLPPSYVAFLDAETGKFEEMRAITPQTFGQKDDPSAFIGRYEVPVSLMPEEFVAQREQLYQEYDLLMPLFAEGQTRVSPETRHLADEFRQRFLLVTETPLEPYYSEAGEEFFRWLYQVIR
ncbi:MAG: hypothetical protein ACE5G0_10120 [Rhodothermales bacterium]